MSAPAADRVLSTRELNRALLARQHLLARVELPVPQMIAHLLGLQAQAPTPPYYGLWSRIGGFRPDQLSDLIEARTVVRIVVMRGTVHALTADDALLLRPMLQSMLEQSVRGQPPVRAVLDKLDLASFTELARDLLVEQPRTVAELSAALAGHWPGCDQRGLGQLSRVLLPMVQVPPRGLWGRSGQPVCAHLAEWVDRPLVTDPPVGPVVLRYLAAFGPASVLDFQAWSGLRRQAPVFEALRGQLASFRDERGRELFDLPDAPRPAASTVAPVRLLAPFDNVLLSHADRTRIMTDVDRALIITQNGLVHGTVLVDGFACGSWDIRRTASTATVVISPFRPVAKRAGNSLTAEARRLLRFAAPDVEHEVQFTDH